MSFVDLLSWALIVFGSAFASLQELSSPTSRLFQSHSCCGDFGLLGGWCINNWFDVAGWIDSRHPQAFDDSRDYRYYRTDCDSCLS